MDASEREKERLRKLAQLYEREDLSDEQYRREYERIAAEFQEVSDDTMTRPALDADMLSYLEERRAQETPQTQTPKGREARQEMQGQRQEDFVRPKTAASKSGKGEFMAMPRDTFSSSGSLPNIKPTIAMRRIRPMSGQLMYVPLVFCIGIALALALGFVRGAKVRTLQTKNANVEASLSQNAEVKSMTPQSAMFIVPKFGPEAVELCQSGCGRWGAQEQRVCMRGCKRRSLEMYGRRITLEELNPQAEADAVIQACLSKPLSLARAENEQLWRASVAPFIAGLAESEKGKGAYYSRELYQTLYRAQSEALLPPSTNPAQEAIGEKLLRASCLVAHDALALWAFETVERQDDDFSAAFYAQFREELAKPKLERTTAAKRDAGSVWQEFRP